MYEIHIQAQVQDVNFQECGEINTNVQFSGARNVGIPARYVTLSSIVDYSKM